jgi:hypothetical protein
VARATEARSRNSTESRIFLIKYEEIRMRGSHFYVMRVLGLEIPHEREYLI